MRRLYAVVILACGCVFLQPVSVHAQFRGGPDWVTAGGDAQRSGWIRTDPKISVDRLSKPGFELVWKVKVSHDTGPADTLSRYIGYRGFRSLAFLASPTGNLTAIDTDLGRIEWTKALPTNTAHSGPAGCSGGTTPELTRATTVAFPGAPAGRGGGMMGRSGPAKSGVGAPGEGAVILTEIAARAAADAGRAGPGRGAGGFGFQRMPSFLDVLSSDGMLHRLYVSNGEEPAPPIPFLDRDANTHGLIVINNVAYTATSHGCGGVPNGIWALDLASKQATHWTADGDIAGDDGPAFGPDGTVYATTANGELVALDGKTLQVKGTYHSGGQAFTTSPLVFEHKTKTLVAAASTDNRIHLVDTQSLAGAAYEARVSGPLASWQDAAGTRWIAAPSTDGIRTWKVADQGEATVLQAAWTSREMAAPMAPIIVNGVIFAVSNSASPILYALDGATGKELWNSGKTMTATVRSGKLTGSDSQIYLGTSDGTVYAFGFPIEH